MVRPKTVSASSPAKLIAALIPVPLIKKIEKAAKKRGVSKSQIIREALENELVSVKEGE